MFPRLSTVFRYATLLVLIVVSAIMIFQLGTNSDVTSEEIILPMEVYDVEPIRRGDIMTSLPKHTARSTTAIEDDSTDGHQHKSANPHSFEYRINPVTQCAGQEVFLVTYVHSAPANFKKRQTIRETWGHHTILKRHNVRVVFIMGTVPEAYVMNMVDMEANRYGDIVQENFVDSYRNLTHKAIAGIKWVSSYCPNAKFVLKTDDDILVNFHTFLEFIKSTVQKAYGTKGLIVCNQWIRMKVMRDKRSKWYIPKEDFPEDYFPPYCSGSAYLMSADVVDGMYKASMTTPFFWVDDYYITGMLIQRLNLTHRRYNQAYILNPGVVVDKFNNDKENSLVFFHVHKLRTMYQLWRNMTMKHLHKMSLSGSVTKPFRPSSTRSV
ncbi:beta-1,3-galactosyltransferase 5-like [Haliotis rubra]|uniref:beta-1,3-galactosyltransferase 5-like n=1 Tax=Haliotis rubra TaxID=36100 RepID=UPI001EE527BE|nr:beta-1,3-galactosyltransferase 5-like [Haliotis rubra]XP_046544860.1 beta-1,3-galactosyltransferase 5-like [Haliotis rubra]XP_046544861.1 beta-1,3-galactosyltransferase 5-like [Haliotis rubra]XP_046544862.1 beta-1,3-galactosyltransferase 5-like [Haliotis rubra]XP_046544863.1 beta-1,3-galactosyltransferase 5-like [Haliotis rubra]